MNPVILLVCFVVFAFGIATALPVALLAAALLLVLARRHAGHGVPAGTLRRSLRRVRWLLVAVVLTHGWFTPGLTLLPALGALSPTQQGIWLALWRALVLLELVAAAALVLAVAGADGIAGALYRLAPARGGFREHLAVRVALCLQAVPGLQAALVVPAAGGSRLARWIRGARSVFDLAARPTDGFAPAPTLTVPVPPVPALREWLLPAALALGFSAVHGLA